MQAGISIVVAGMAGLFVLTRSDLSSPWQWAAIPTFLLVFFITLFAQDAITRNHRRVPRSHRRTRRQGRRA